MTDCKTLLAKVGAKIRRDLYCEKMPNGELVITGPFVTIDGDNFEVLVSPISDTEFFVTDAGESTRFLASYGINFADSLVRNEHMDTIKALLEVNFERESVNVRCDERQLADAILRVLEAQRFISDMVYTASPREESEFKDVVRATLRPLAQRKFEENVDLKGQSETTYRVDYYVRNFRDLWIALITGQRRSTFQQKLDHVHSMWNDVLPSVRKLTIIDDESLAQNQDFRKMRQVGPVVGWSDRAGVEGLVASLTSSPPSKT